VYCNCQILGATSRQLFMYRAYEPLSEVMGSA